MSTYTTNPFDEATRPPARTGSVNAGVAAPPAPGAPPAYSSPPPYHPPAGSDPNGPQFYQPTSQGYTNVAYQPPATSDQYGGPPRSGAYAYGSGSPAGQPAGNGQPAGRSEGPQPQLQPQPQQPVAPPARELQTEKFWQLAFYQQFFDVDTVDVLKRMGNTLVPVSPPDFLIFRRWHLNQVEVPVETSLEAGAMPERMPDLYGPFWVCTTLWMALAIVGNMMSKISHSRALANHVVGTPETWTYDFTVASVACAVIYSYCAGMPLLLWGLMYWKHVPVTLVDTLALYGYSMFIFLLAAILCAIPIPLVQWITVFVCGVWSTIYLLMNLWHIWKLRLRGTWFIFIVLLVSIMHIGVTASFKFYFLNYTL